MVNDAQSYHTSDINAALRLWEALTRAVINFNVINVSNNDRMADYHITDVNDRLIPDMALRAGHTGQY